MHIKYISWLIREQIYTDTQKIQIQYDVNYL